MISASRNFNVTDATPASEGVTETVQPPAGVGTGGRGRLIHPTLGLGDTPVTYDYEFTPDERQNVETIASPRPEWAMTRTLQGATTTRWDGAVRGTIAIERWIHTEVGAPLTHVGALYQMFANPPDQDAGSYIQWWPNYSIPAGYYVVLRDLRVGGVSAWQLGSRIADMGFAPGPIELEIEVISLISEGG